MSFWSSIKKAVVSLFKSEEPALRQELRVLEAQLGTMAEGYAKDQVKAQVAAIRKKLGI